MKDARDTTPTKAFVLLGAVVAAACGGEDPLPPEPPPPPPNQAPQTVGAIPPQSVNTGETATVDVASYFRDPDGGALRYTAATSNPGVVSVAVSGTSLALVGVADGTATVTVTATDPGGLTAAQSVAVTVQTPNRAPQTVGAIPARSLDARQTVRLDVASYFRDPDGDGLGYEAATSAAGVVSVSISGSRLTLVGVAQGTATVTVTARDPGGLTAAQRVAVTVRTPNRAPQAVGSIPAQNLVPGRTATLDVASYFRDPDGDALTYEAATSAVSVVSVSISGSRLTLVGVAEGTATVAVTARDPGGLSATRRFASTVLNQAPEPSGSIPDQTVQAGETVWLDVSPYFTDPDGDALTYTATSSDASVASVSISGSAVRIQGISVGSTVLTVNARDPDGGHAIQRATIGVTAPGPDLAFTGVSPTSATLLPGESVMFTFDIRNRGTVASVATTIRAVRSTNPTVSPRDTELVSFSLSSLAPSQTHRFLVTITVDANSAPGTIYIGACVDAAGNEVNTENNCSAGARLTIGSSSDARDSADSAAPIRVRASRPTEPKRPVPPF